MGFQSLFSAGAISGSGMSAERYRMEVIANNIANAQTTRSANGGAYRRQDVVFEEMLGASRPGAPPALAGVRTAGLVEDQSELSYVIDPAHPDADEFGRVYMPNVHLPIEMVNMLTAARAYEANLKAAQTFKQMSEQALNLLRG